MDLRLGDGLLALEDCSGVELVDVLVLVGGREGLDGGLDGLLLGVGVVAGEDEAGCAAHVEVGGVFGLLRVGLEEED